MNTAPEHYLSRDADGFMDRITDLMLEDDAVLGPPGSSQKVLVPIKHVGTKAQRADNVAGTGLIWVGNETQLVSDEAAVKLIKHPDVWAFDEEYLRQASGTIADGLVPIVVHISQADFEALQADEAEVMVVHHDANKAEGQPTQPDTSLLDAGGPAAETVPPAEETPGGDEPPPAEATLNDELAALDKDGLLAYAEAHGLKVDKRTAVEKLRAVILAALATAE